MRVAFVSLMSGSHWGASEILWAQTAQRALAEHHNVFVSIYGWPQLPEAVAELERLGAIVDARPLTRWLRRSSTATRLAGTFRGLVRFSPDMICISQGGTYDIARNGSIAVLRQTLRRLKVPYALLCHCEQPKPAPRNAVQARLTFAEASIVALLARRAQEVTERDLGMTLHNARIFHNPVNLRRVAYVPWPTNRSRLRLAFVGRLEPVKNLQTLLTALGKEQWSQRDWTLTMFGSGSLRRELETCVTQNHLAARCVFAGHVENIESVWAEHHALVLPSRFEGVPLAMIEALLCGRPVVATNTGGISEWISDGETGFLVHNPPDVSAISDALERLWSCRDDLEAMGRRAHSCTVAKRDPDPAGTLLEWLSDEARSHSKT